jgi:predicted homoserine dehydrogenase-like protein
MRVGILGSGFMGGTHARAYAKMKGVEVAAISLERYPNGRNRLGD